MNDTDTSLPLALYRAEQVRALDRFAIDRLGIPGLTLMRRAGREVFERLLAAYPQVRHITVFCGTGNNGGDGYVVATLAQQKGIGVEVVQIGDVAKIRGDALQARQLAIQDGVPVTAFKDSAMPAGGVIVDAMLGTGLQGEVRGEYAAAIAAINQSGLPVMAVDIPSGLCSDTGVVLGEAVYAADTITFIGVKQGLLTGAAPDYTGVLWFSDLDVPAEVYAEAEPGSVRLDLEVAMSLLPPRCPTAHKGQSGHVLVVGGDRGMAGAAVMASQAAARTGAGLTSCATRPEHVAALVSRCPEVMAHGADNGQAVAALIEKASVMVIGPGLGAGPWGEQMLQRALHSALPLVVDADALNLISAGKFAGLARRENWILTPHPGEAARLLGCDTATIQRDRFAAVAELQRRYGGAVVLKGAGTLVADGCVASAGLAGGQPSPTGVCPYGNPGMASGGMGDVLSGVLGALLAQGLDVGDAARLGVCLHACAADLASLDGERGMLATDLLPHIRQLVSK